ncbi:MAG: DNA-3-methyladenine glycosylase [Chthoniobacterales bacterium]
MRRRDASTLPVSFFERDPLTCARELIGTELIWGACAGIVVETEAYLSENDEACHCFVRPSTRAFLARNKPGAAYIYLNYGVHWMLNAVTKGAAGSGFVLVRAVQPTAGIELMRTRRRVDDIRQLCSGPGKLTQALEITRATDERDLCGDPRHGFLAGTAPVEVVADERIGITKSAELPWRFTLRGSRFVSRPVKQAR